MREPVPASDASSLALYPANALTCRGPGTGVCCLIYRSPRTGRMLSGLTCGAAACACLLPLAARMWRLAVAGAVAWRVLFTGMRAAVSCHGKDMLPRPSPTLPSSTSSPLPPASPRAFPIPHSHKLHSSSRREAHRSFTFGSGSPPGQRAQLRVRRFRRMNESVHTTGLRSDGSIFFSLGAGGWVKSPSHLTREICVAKKEKKEKGEGAYSREGCVCLFVCCGLFIFVRDGSFSFFFCSFLVIPRRSPLTSLLTISFSLFFFAFYLFRAPFGVCPYTLFRRDALFGFWSQLLLFTRIRAKCSNPSTKRTALLITTTRRNCPLSKHAVVTEEASNKKSGTITRRTSIVLYY